jgi:hypothetical protein
MVVIFLGMSARKEFLAWGVSIEKGSLSSLQDVGI